MKNSYFQLLAICWFWWWLFRIRIINKKVNEKLHLCLFDLTVFLIVLMFTRLWCLFFWPQALWKTVLCPFFSFEFTMFVRPELIFQWESLFFFFEAYWKWIFQWESLFLWFQHYWKLIFEWKSLFFWCQAYWKLIFQWKCLFFWFQAYWKLFFQWESLFLRPQTLWKTVLCPFFQMNLQCF